MSVSSEYSVIIISDSILSDVVNELNMKDFVVAYGMTETSPVTFQVH